MTREEIEKAKEEYNKLLLVRKEFLDAWDKIDKLRNNSDVIKYKDILKLTYNFNEEEFEEILKRKVNEHKRKTNKDYALQAFYPIAKHTKKPNDIYVYSGLNEVQEWGRRVSVKPDNIPKEGHLIAVYYDLETSHETWHSLDKDENFIKENTVIFVPEVTDDCAFQDFQSNFFLQLIENPDNEEEIVKNILTKYKKESK